MKTAIRSLSATLLAALAGLAQAQQPPSLPNNYPSRPVLVLVGSSPGGGVDTMTRLVMKGVSEKWGRSFVIENRTGAGGVIAVETLARAKPDGYTMYGGGSQITTSTPLKKVNFDTRKAIQPVAQMTRQSYFMLVHPSVPAKNVKELIALARAKPGTLNYASAGVGAVTHLGMELFKSMAGGMDMQHVPFKGNGQAYGAIVANQVQVMFSSGISATPYVKSGKLRLIATTGDERMEAQPDVPTVDESGVKDFDLDNMYGIYTTAGVPDPIVNALNREIVAIIRSPEMRAKLEADGSEAAPPLTAAQFKARVAKEVERWDTFIKKEKIELDKL
jgi:tripartite-type tricarboxylate transporter receptor subunit TctC